MDNNMTASGQGFAAAPKKNTARDLFLHLLGMITLYWSAINFATLCWKYADYFFPDNLSIYSNNFAVSFALSTIIVMFPIFIFVSWYLNRIYRREPVVRESSMRKWLIYITLFITSLVVIGDLITVVNVFLSGEITARFFLKALTIVVVAAVVFSYYLIDVKSPQPTRLAKYYAWVCGLVVLFAVVGAFFITGSPAKMRAIRFDATRVSSLQSIVSQINYYYQRTGNLPLALSDLESSSSYYNVPKDPETNKDFEYIVINRSITDASVPTYDICANFSAKSVDTNSSTTNYYYISNPEKWKHDAGRVCFEQKIDTQIYRPYNQPQSPAQPLKNNG